MLGVAQRADAADRQKSALKQRELTLTAQLRKSQRRAANATEAAKGQAERNRQLRDEVEQLKLQIARLQVAQNKQQQLLKAKELGQAKITAALRLLDAKFGLSKTASEKKRRRRTDSPKEKRPEDMTAEEIEALPVAERMRIKYAAGGAAGTGSRGGGTRARSGSGDEPEELAAVSDVRRGVVPPANTYAASLPWNKGKKKAKAAVLASGGEAQVYREAVVVLSREHSAATKEIEQLRADLAEHQDKLAELSNQVSYLVQTSKAKNSQLKRSERLRAGLLSQRRALLRALADGGTDLRGAVEGSGRIPRLQRSGTSRSLSSRAGSRRHLLGGGGSARGVRRAAPRCAVLRARVCMS